MKRLSLKLRSVLAALLALGLFIPVTVLILDNAYTRSLGQAKLNELKLMNLALVSAFELDDGNAVMPELLYEEQLNLPDSGYIGIVVFRNKVVWQSASALHFDIQHPPASPGVGEERFIQDTRPHFDSDAHYFTYGFTAEFAGPRQFEPVQFYILNNRSEFDRERETFLATVWRNLLALGVVLLLLLLGGISIILAPVRSLIAEIKKTSEGRQAALIHSYPAEFAGLKRSINRLLQTEAQQRKRYKNSLGDLAHSLKTPLAVALGTPALPPEASDALLQIDQLIQRQLKRATAGQKGWQAPVPVGPLVERISGAMAKVYRDKALNISLDIDPTAQFLGDETDLFEMLGNLLDNACKAAAKQVRITCEHQARYLVIKIEDDGPGIAAHLRQTLLERGARLDTYTEGQGIGMAVVSDLVDIYQGQLEVYDSELGGAGVQIRFALPASS